MAETPCSTTDRTARRRATALHKRLARLRPVVQPGFDCTVWAVSLIAATALRYDIVTQRWAHWGIIEVIAVAVATQLVVGYVTILYRSRWRVASFEEILALAATIAATGLVLLWADLLVFHDVVPPDAVVAAGAFTFILAAGSRGAWRVVWEHRLRPASHAQRAIIFGAGRGGEQLMRALLANGDTPFIPVGLLDDDPAKKNLRIRNLVVTGGRQTLPALAVRSAASCLIVAIPSATSELIRELSTSAAACDLQVRVLPPVADLLAPSRVELSDLRPVTPEDLLGRHQVDTEVEAISGYLTGRRVLVTGAGGSIGSELCRQIHGFEPAELIMLDRDESGLHGVQLLIEGKALLDSRNLVVCDIRDGDAVQAVFEEHHPEVVFHAAALKHLPLLEMWPTEAVKTNIRGTRNVLDAALAYSVERFVNISTDKAADPTSVLGYTKRIAERLTATYASRTDGQYVSVRFGNVLASRGSVLGTFRAQIAAGGPVTVTHRDVTRFFMTVEEAVQLVIQAGAIGGHGQVLVLDMGTPVSIREVAERLVAQADRPVAIRYTGLRPGEKLHESLFSAGEAPTATNHPLISRAEVPPLDEDAVRPVQPGWNRRQVLAELARHAVGSGSDDLDERAAADSAIRLP